MRLTFTHPANEANLPPDLGHQLTETGMNNPFVRRSTFSVAALGCGLLLTACEDKHLKQLDTGITRDSAMTVISKDVAPNAKPDSFPNVYVRERYLIAGKNYEVLYFTPHNEKAGKEPVPFKDLTPIVFTDNKLVGRGWTFWDSMATANKIPLKKKDSVLVLPNQYGPKKG
jgi:hypothetical protein